MNNSSLCSHNKGFCFVACFHCTPVCWYFCWPLPVKTGVFTSNRWKNVSFWYFRFHGYQQYLTFPSLLPYLVLRAIWNITIIIHQLKRTGDKPLWRTRTMRARGIHVWLSGNKWASKFWSLLWQVDDSPTDSKKIIRYTAIRLSSQ